MNAQQLAEDLAGRLGLRKRPRSWGGTCPVCRHDYGTFWIKADPRFARPSLNCSNGCSRQALEAEAERVLMSSWAPPPAADAPDRAKVRAKNGAAAARLFAGAAAVTRDNPAGLYLRRRLLGSLIGCTALRFRADTWHPKSGRLRAVIAEVVDVAGRPIACHRTYVDADGRKADVDPPKASLGPVWGGAVRLAPVAAELVIGEGIETAASAGVLLNLPAWAAISAGNMAAALELPAEVCSVVIAGDHDGPGRKAAREAFVRWRAEGRAVRVIFPDRTGEDWNDVLMARVAGRA